uniref:Uncharacterized protein n=1 Tax=Terrapene triunguis TaxID=2587831 RepID=A0A674JBC0_9SAUR
MRPLWGGGLGTRGAQTRCVDAPPWGGARGLGIWGPLARHRDAAPGMVRRSGSLGTPCPALRRSPPGVGRRGDSWETPLLLSAPPVLQRGVNPTSVEELQLQPGDSSTLQEGQTLWLVNGRYPYTLRFLPAPHSPRRSLLDFFRGSSGLPPHPRDSWEEHGKLLVFTKEGVVPSTKVPGWQELA